MDVYQKTLIGLVILSAISAALCLFQIRYKNTAKWLDFAAGVQLILFAAFFLGLIGDLVGIIPDTSNSKSGYQVALLIIPFFTAGIGTNIISNVVLAERNYKDAQKFSEFCSDAGKALFYFLICVVPIVTIPYLLLSKNVKPKP